MLTQAKTASDTSRAAAQATLVSSGASVAVGAFSTSAAAKHQVTVELLGGERLLALNRPHGEAIANVDIVVTTKTDESFSDIEPHLDIARHIETLLTQANWTDGSIEVHNVRPDVAFSGTIPPDDGSDSWLLVRTLSFEILYSDSSNLPDDVATL